ncbi:LysM peptidoglycan-binding domain-containing protein [bacterium]|nr:LysM peptidoglycan-binding domain-containing protein [bacterium]
MKQMTFVFVLMFSLLISAEEVPPASAEEVPVPEFINLDTVDLTVAPEEYTVVQGDTLWDISEANLKSPWYWPKVWSLNPQISNPHMIYPGDKISFRQTGEVMMPNQEGTNNAAVAGEGEESSIYGTTEDEGETDELALTGKTLDATPENFKDYVKIGGKYRIDRFKQIDDQIFDVVTKGFVGNAEEEELAEVVGSYEPKELLATNDNVYVKIGDDEDDKDKDKKDKKEKKEQEKFEIGDYVEFLNVRDEIEHPTTGKKVGVAVDIVGIGKVLDINKDNIATVKITKAYDAIERKFRVRKYVETDKNIQIKETKEDIAASIIAGYDPTVFYGENYLVYIDKGTNDGVEKGIMLSVFRRGDGLDELEGDVEDTQLPYEFMGEIVVIDAGENTSLAVITNSITGIEAGDSAISGVPECSRYECAPECLPYIDSPSEYKSCRNECRSKCKDDDNKKENKE